MAEQLPHGGEESLVSALSGGGEVVPSGITPGITPGTTPGIAPGTTLSTTSNIPVEVPYGTTSNIPVDGADGQSAPAPATPSVDEEDKYEFLSYSNYFFLEEQNYVNTYCQVKDVLKNTNPTLGSFFKYISLLSHVIYFDQVEEKKLLTSSEVQNINHILLKNEQSNISSCTVAYSCIVLLLDVIKLSPHSGIKSYVYCQLAKNAKKIEDLFFAIYSFQKGKHRDHSYVVRKNEAVFISDFVTLNVINLLNGEDKLTRSYGLKLCLLFCQHLSVCNHLVHMVLKVIFKKIDFDEFALALLVLTRWTPFLSHDVLYHVVRGLYRSVVGPSGRGKHLQRNAGGSPPNGCPEGEVNQASKQSHTESDTQNDTQSDAQRGEQPHTGGEPPAGEGKKGPILDDPFTFTISMYLSKIANRMNGMVPYVSYFLFRKLWKMINKLFDEEEPLCSSEGVALFILRAYFHSTTVLSHQNGFLTNLQIVLIKFLLMAPQTRLMKRRQLTYFALKSLLFLIKKKSIHVFPFVEEMSGRRNAFDQRVNSFHFAYFSFVSAVRECELVGWLNRLPLCRGDSPALLMFVKIVYRFFKAASGGNYPTCSGKKGENYLTRSVKGENYLTRSGKKGDNCLPRSGKKEHNCLPRSGKKGGPISPRLANYCKEENADEVSAGEVIPSGSHPNRRQMDFLPTLSRAHRDPFIHNFVCTMRESLPIEVFHPDSYPKGEQKFTPDCTVKEEEHLPIGSGGDQLANPPDKENSDQREEKKISSGENGSAGGEERGQFCFTITLSDSGGSDDGEAGDGGHCGVRGGGDGAGERFAQESPSNLAKSDRRSRQRRVDLFFERFIQLAKESEEASDINVKNLDITLKIRGRGGQQGKQWERQEKQQKQQQEEPLTEEDPKAERETHPANERADQAEAEPVKGHHPRRESNVPPKREDGTLLNSKQHHPYSEDPSKEDSGKSSLSDAISEISNDQNGSPKQSTKRDSFYTQVRTDKRGKLRKEMVLLYSLKWLKKNKIKHHSFVQEDNIKNFISEESFFPQFKRAFLKKKKKKYSRLGDRRGVNKTYNFGEIHHEGEGLPSGEGTPEDSILHRVMFIRLLFFLYRHTTDSVATKLCILKTLTVLGKYIVCDEDVRDFVNLFNFFFQFFVHNKGDSNVEADAIGEVYRMSKNGYGMGRGAHMGGRSNFPNRRGSKYSHSGTHLSYDDEIYTCRGMGGPTTPSDLEAQDETNFDLFLNDQLQRRLNERAGESNNSCVSYQQSGAFKSAMQTCLLSVAANLGNSANGHLLNCLFQSFCSNEFVPFFHLLFTLRAEKIMHILRDPFFYLLIDGQATEEDSPRGKASGEYGMSSNRSTEEARRTAKRTSLGTGVSLVRGNSRAKGNSRVYFLKRSKFFQTFNICQREDDHPASYHNVRHLFHLALVSYGKGEEVSTALRRKVYVFLSILNHIFSFKERATPFWHAVRGTRQKKKKKICTGQANFAGDGSQVLGKENQGGGAPPRRGSIGSIGSAGSVRSVGSGASNGSYGSNSHDSYDSSDCSGSGDTPPSTLAASDGQPSSAERDHPSDCSSISSLSNKSLRRKVQNVYRKLQHQERVPSEENVQVANLKKNESSLFYLYRSGKYCMCAGFYKHGYAIFGKLLVLANSGDVKLWFRALMNYCKFFYRKRNKSYGDWKSFLSPTKFLLISEQCIKEVRTFQQNFFLYGFFVKVQMGIYRAVEDLLTLVSDIRDEINFTLAYFVCNVERIISSLVETTLGILTLAGIRHLFAGLSKRVLFLYFALLKSTFVLCLFLRHKVIPFLFLSPSCVLRAPPLESASSVGSGSAGSDEGSAEGSSGGSGGGNSEWSCQRSGGGRDERQALVNIGSCTLRDLVRFYLNKRKIKRMRKNIFAKEVADTQGKNFPDVFDHVMALWQVAASKFFFYEHVQKIKELYRQFFRDGMVNKKKVLAFMKVYLEVVYRMDLPAPPRVFSSVAVPYVASSTYVYRSTKGRAPCEMESLKCVGRLVSPKVTYIRGHKEERKDPFFVVTCVTICAYDASRHPSLFLLYPFKAAPVRDFHSCNVKLILKNKVIREANVRSQGMNVTYTAHIKMGEDDWKHFGIFLTPLDRRKKLLGQAAATVLCFRYA
ncbi:hypothetical protein PVIIG_05477 [Plasmodium vivax India VII]|uniref:Uncharacterized protein n=1 Tax=Plasmodium vivax India VII TaxID=1077284 RepID=A0A0J9SJ57_PLAVI|nr:hypothetical protein PVIIG_05477 [Plasmodium vivax India VII]